MFSRIFSSCGRDCRRGNSPSLPWPKVAHPTLQTTLSKPRASSSLQRTTFQHPRVIGETKVKFASCAPSCHSRMLFKILCWLPKVVYIGVTKRILRLLEIPLDSCQSLSPLFCSPATYAYLNISSKTCFCIWKAGSIILRIQEFPWIRWINVFKSAFLENSYYTHTHSASSKLECSFANFHEQYQNNFCLAKVTAIARNTCYLDSFWSSISPRSSFMDRL